MRPDRELRCVEVVELVTAYLERRLGAPEVERFERHLTACDGCTTYLDQMRVTIAATGRIRDDDIPAGLFERLVATFRLVTGGAP
ncbi:MAG TPA: zf-HC2 domain-containing protein [Gaiellaceae bacterium]|nr:zf-HC2 domain-containing protein [Gaiellaceae bacterium]